MSDAPAPEGANSRASERAAVVREAMSFLGTAFHHMGRCKIVRGADGTVIDRGGADCAQSVYLIFRAALPHRIPELAPTHYAFTWNTSRHCAAREEYLGAVLAHAHEIEHPLPGDLVLYRWGLAWAHGAIVMPPGWPAIAHASIADGGFARGTGDGGPLARRKRRFFSVWGEAPVQGALPA